MSNSVARVVNKRPADNLADMKSDKAAIPTRSTCPPSARGTSRSPVESTAPAQKSEGTSPHEGFRIRSTCSRCMALAQGKGRRGVNATDKGTDSLSQRRAFVGFDWASDHHDVVVVDEHVGVPVSPRTPGPQLVPTCVGVASSLNPQSSTSNSCALPVSIPARWEFASCAFPLFRADS